MGRYVEVQDRTQSVLFPERLDDWIHEDSTVRVIDVFVDELDLRKLGFERADPAATGRPGYSPVSLLKINVYGYPPDPGGGADNWLAALAAVGYREIVGGFMQLQGPAHPYTGVEMRSSRATLFAALAAVVLCIGVGPAAATPVDGFEGGLPAGVDGAITTGFFTFAGGGSATIATTLAPPAPVPGAVASNTVLMMTVQTTDFAGFVHVFESTTNTLAPRDWSSFDAMTLWLYGNNTGNEMYIDVLDNYSASNGYPFEIWTSAFKDDFSGWKQLSFAFSNLMRKEIGNFAPNDGLGLTAVHGWALGAALGTNGSQTYYVDDVRLVSSVPEPGTLALLGAALLMMRGIAHRRRPIQH